MNVLTSEHRGITKLRSPLAVAEQDASCSVPLVAAAADVGAFCLILLI